MTNPPRNCFRATMPAYRAADTLVALGRGTAAPLEGPRDALVAQAAHPLSKTVASLLTLRGTVLLPGALADDYPLA